MRLGKVSGADDGCESLPGALGAYALGVGVSNIGETLPAAAYALLSGLNGATVGIIAVAAVSWFFPLVFAFLKVRMNTVGRGRAWHVLWMFVELCLQMPHVFNPALFAILSQVSLTGTTRQ